MYVYYICCKLEINSLSLSRNVNSRAIYYKVTDEHIQPEHPQKMRIMAEEMLNDQILTLMQTLGANSGVIPRWDS